MRQRRLHHQDWPAQVDLQAKFDVTIEHGLQVARYKDRGVVDENIEASPLIDDALRRRADALRVAQVENNGDRGSAVGFDLSRDRVNRARQSRVLHLFGPRCDTDLGASRG